MSHAVMNTGSDVLDRIMAHKAGEVAQAKKMVSEATLLQQISQQAPTRGFAQAVTKLASMGEPAIIAEVKKASPSKGLIRADFSPGLIAQQYEQAGACCLSVLTDQEFFQGSNLYLRAAREATTLPILRKDFMLDSYQVLEARAMGADCILLIAAALEDALMLELAQVASEYDLDVLIEVHNKAELERAMRLQPRLIGINNRNLRDFTTSLETTLELVKDIPSSVTVVTESGIHSRDDVERMRANTVNAFLVGEAFMRAEHPGEQLRELFY